MTVGQTTANIDMALETGGTISGYVYQQDGSTPIPNTSVDVYTDRCHNGHLYGTQTDDQRIILNSQGCPWGINTFSGRMPTAAGNILSASGTTT